MVVLLVIMALTLGVVTAVLLWPYGAVVALLAAPVVASSVVVVASVAFAARSGSKARANPVLDALNKFLAR